MRLSTRLFVVLALALAVGLATAVSPYASSHPDGLEKVAGDEGFVEQGTLHAIQDDSPIADYAFPGIGNERLATGVAGFVGTLGVFAVGFGLAFVLLRRAATTGSTAVGAAVGGRCSSSLELVGRRRRSVEPRPPARSAREARRPRRPDGRRRDDADRRLARVGRVRAGARCGGGGGTDLAAHGLAARAARPARSCCSSAPSCPSRAPARSWPRSGRSTSRARASRCGSRRRSRPTIGTVSAVLLGATTAYPQVLRALEALRVPRTLTLIAAFMYRYLFVIVDEVRACAPHATPAATARARCSAPAPSGAGQRALPAHARARRARLPGHALARLRRAHAAPRAADLPPRRRRLRRGLVLALLPLRVLA